MSGLTEAEREALCICAALSPPLDHDTVKAVCVERMAQSEAILAARAEAAEAKVAAVEALADDIWRYSTPGECADALRAALAEATPCVHAVDYEDTTDPDHHGRVLVTGVCACGHVMYVHHDSVL